jgi:hypothetical protein
VKHIDNWFAFARKLGLGIERIEEIILVTGCDRTKSWANIAFFGNQADSQASFGVRVEGPDPKITFQFPLENAQGAVLHHGPDGKVRLYAIHNIRRVEKLWHDSLPVRTCLRINVYSSGDFVSLAPSGYCQGVSRRQLVPLQTQRATTVIQTWKLYQYPQLQR